MRWNREQAIDYMVSNTGMAQSDVIAEIERYFIMPGQALAYKVDMTNCRSYVIWPVLSLAINLIFANFIMSY